MSYERNFSRELIEEVTGMERNHDRLVFALQALVRETTGTGKGRIQALKLLHEITGENYESLDNTNSEK